MRLGVVEAPTGALPPMTLSPPPVNKTYLCSWQLTPRSYYFEDLIISRKGPNPPIATFAAWLAYSASYISQLIHLQSVDTEPNRRGPKRDLGFLVGDDRDRRCARSHLEYRHAR